jgi:two-component system nitrogen regulation sensor histidine kinase NtrY
MVSKPAGRSPFVLGVVVRSAVIGVLAMVVVQLVTQSQLYATALVVACLAAVVIADLTRSVTRADQRVEQLIAALGTGDHDRPIGASARQRRALDTAILARRAGRASAEQRIDALQAQLDAVAAVLLVVHSDGRVTAVNRAAHALVGEPVVSLAQVLSVGAPAAAVILGLPPGARRIVVLADGRSVLASVAQFAVPGQPPQRLISLQRLAGELDAVQLKAWHDMVHVLAHEIMNSLTPIASLSESLEGLLHGAAGPQSPAFNEIGGAVEAIRRRSATLMKFVERYRQVASIPSVVARTVPLADLFTHLQALLRADVVARGVALSCRIEPPDLCAVIDRELMEQALINLLRNALDAVAACASPRIDIECTERDGRTVVTIADNGTGLPAGSLEQVFVPFFSTKHGGSGIGLSLARQIALAHGGQIEAARRQPAGSVMTLVLPGRQSGAPPPH